MTALSKDWKGKAASNGPRTICSMKGECKWSLRIASRGQTSTRSRTGFTGSIHRSSWRESPGGFTFNQYLIVDDDPLIFHTGPRKTFPVVREAVASVIPVERSVSRSFACGGGRMRIPEPVARGSSPRHALCGRWLPWSRSATSPTDRPGPWPTARPLPWAHVRVNGSIRRICRMPGNAASCMECTREPLLCGDLFTQGGSGLPRVDRVGHPRSQRGVPAGHGLLLSRAGRASAS